MSKKIKLLNSQRELLRLKRTIANEAFLIAQQRAREFDNTVGAIALEQGISRKDIGQWQLTKDEKYFRPVKKEK